MIHWFLVAIILISVFVFAGIVTFVVFYLIQMRAADRTTIRENREHVRELHDFIVENRAAIAELQKRNRLSGGEGD